MPIIPWTPETLEGVFDARVFDQVVFDATQDYFVSDPSTPGTWTPEAPTAPIWTPEVGV